MPAKTPTPAEAAASLDKAADKLAGKDATP